MDSGTEYRAADPPKAGNDNSDPFDKADTALAELYRVKRWLVSQDTSHLTIEQMRERRRRLKMLDDAIAAVIPYV